MRNIQIKESVPYPLNLEVGDENSMVFDEEDEGPFYLSYNH